MPESPQFEQLQPGTFRLLPGTTLVEASAGTGKTYTLQYLFLDLLLQGVGIEEIIVLTYTELATKELKERLGTFLQQVFHQLVDEGGRHDSDIETVLQRALKEQGPAQVEALLHAALQRRDLATISTIHGFCQRILRENALYLPGSAEGNVVPDESELLRECVEGILWEINGQIRFPLPDSFTVHKLMLRAQKLKCFLRTEAAPVPDLHSLEEPLQAALEEVKDLAGDLREVESAFCALRGKLKKTSYKDTFWDELRTLLDQLRSDPLSLSTKELGLLGLDKLQNNLKKGDAHTPLEHPLFAACDALIEAKSEWTESLTWFFDTSFIATYHKLKREGGLLTYDDMISELERALRKNAPFRKSLQSRYTAALVDEFQDTDSRQYSILNQLFMDREGACLAMIGDPKQAIYGFRGADINAYLKARACAGRHARLPTNYRSSEALVEGVNRFFEGVHFTPGPEKIIAPAVAAADLPERKRVFFESGERFDGLVGRVIPTTGGPMKESLAATLQASVEDVHYLLARARAGEITLGRDRSEARPLREGDIALLVDKHEEASTLQRLLRERGIPAVRFRTQPVIQCEESRHFQMFLSTLLEPHPRQLNALLVTPLFGFTDARLRALTENNRAILLRSFAEWGSGWRSRVGVRRVWMELLEREGVRERLLSLPDGERRLTNYLHLGEIAQTLEQQERLSPERLLDRWKVLRTEGGLEENPMRLETDEAAVAILTLHSSKGLEFPVVLVPSLWQKTCGLNQRCLQATASTDDPDCLHELVEIPPDSELEQSEILRLGYVGLTRARDLCLYYKMERLPSEFKGQAKHHQGWFDYWVGQAGGGTLKEVATPEPGSESHPLLADSTRSLFQAEPRSFTRSLEDSYRISSYTALSGDLDPFEMHEPEKGEDEQLQGEGTLHPEAALHLQSFPPGVISGSCLHEVLEQVWSVPPTDWRPIVSNALARYFPEIMVSRREQMESEVSALLNTLSAEKWPLAQGPALDFSALPARATKAELNFFFPVNTVDRNELLRVLSAWLKQKGYTGPVKIPQGGALAGFLTGSIDLLIELEGCISILDWKSNGPLAGAAAEESFTPMGLIEQMMHGNYYLQALIYSVAAELMIARRNSLGDQTYSLGGFAYVFLRGLGRESGWLTDSFDAKTLKRAREALGCK
jgi:exodeoxyribonuclease V beta subunit